MLKEPLVHFLLIGAALFALHSFVTKDEVRPEDYTIHLTQSDVDRLRQAYQKNWSSEPDSTTLALLVKEEVKAEILYREALRMNLDHNDEIIRRRLKQKYEFLVKDLVSLEQASEEELKAFYETHSDWYQSPKTLSFSQIYFSPDKRATPQKDADLLYQELKTQSAEIDFKAYGDRFHLPIYFAHKDASDIRQSFGQQFADQLIKAETSGWSPPISSGYGIHVVYIHTVEAAAPRAFETVKSRVQQDWQTEQQAAYNDRLYKNLLDQYKINYDY